MLSELLYATVDHKCSNSREAQLVRERTADPNPIRASGKDEVGWALLEAGYTLADAFTTAASWLS